MVCFHFSEFPTGDHARLSGAIPCRYDRNVVSRTQNRNIQLSVLTNVRLVPQSIPYGRLVCLWISFSYTATWTLSMSVATANTAGHTKKVTTNATLLVGMFVPFVTDRSNLTLSQATVSGTSSAPSSSSHHKHRAMNSELE